MISERVLLSFKDKIIINCIRPATVCGISPRMRLDVSVNLLTHHALKNNKMFVFGANKLGRIFILKIWLEFMIFL